jgi:hypothetical protein
MECFTKVNEKLCPRLDKLTKSYRKHLKSLWNLKTTKISLIFIFISIIIQSVLIGISINFEFTCQLLACRNLIFFKPCKPF